VSLEGRLLHSDRLPAAIAPNEDAQVPDLAGKREAAKRTGIISDASENSNVAIDPHDQAVVSH
jgi:hypothetical protein